MKNVMHIHSAVRASTAKSALSKLRLASLAPWALAALCLVGSTAHAGLYEIGTIKMQLQAITPSCSIAAAAANKTINLNGATKVPIGLTFQDWTNRDTLVGSLGGFSLGIWKTHSSWEQTTTIECTIASQKISAFDIVNASGSSDVSGSGREQYLKDSGGVIAFDNEGKVSAFLTAAGSATGLNHGFYDVSGGGKGGAYAPTGGFTTSATANANGKYSINMVWYPIVAAPLNRQLASQTYAGDGLFSADFLINVDY